HHIELQLAQRRGIQVAQVADARHRGAFAQAHTALAGAGYHGAVVGDAETGTDARLLVHELRAPGGHAHLLDNLLHEVRNQHGIVAVETDAGLLLHDVDAAGSVERIVCLDQRTDAVLELGNDLAAAVVSGRVGGEENQDINVELHGIAADLDLA